MTIQTNFGDKLRSVALLRRVAMGVLLLLALFTAGRLGMRLLERPPDAGAAALERGLEELITTVARIAPRTGVTAREDAERLWREFASRASALERLDSMTTAARQHLQRASSRIGETPSLQQRIEQVPERRSELEERFRDCALSAAREIQAAITELRNPPIARLRAERSRTTLELAVALALALLAGALLFREQSIAAPAPIDVATPNGLAPNWGLQVVQSSPEAILTLDEQGRLLGVNPAAEKLLGYAELDIAGKAVSFLLPSFDARKMDRLRLSRSRTGDLVVNGRETARRKDGISVTLEVRFLGFPSEPRILAFLSTAETEAATTARGEGEFLGKVLREAGVPVVVFQRNGEIVRMNRAAEETTGYAMAEVRGTPYWDLFLNGEEVESARRLFQTARREEFPEWREEIWRRRDGESVRIIWARSALADRNGLVEHVVAAGQPARVAVAVPVPVEVPVVADDTSEMAGQLASSFDDLIQVINGYSELGMQSLSPEDPLHADLREIREAGGRAAELTRALGALGVKPRGKGAATGRS